MSEIKWFSVAALVFQLTGLVLVLVALTGPAEAQLRLLLAGIAFQLAALVSVSLQRVADAGADE